MSQKSCWVHPKMKIIGVTHLSNTQDPTKKGAPITAILRKCEKCGEFEEQIVHGHYSIEQLS